MISGCATEECLCYYLSLVVNLSINASVENMLLNCA